MNKTVDVYGCGNGIVDMLAFAEDDDVRTVGLKKGTTTIVSADEQAQILSHLRGKVARQASGGAAANTIIGLRMLGATVGFSCVVGKDVFGHFYSDEMRELGVETAFGTGAQGSTGTCVVLVTPDGQRTMATHLGVSSSFSSAHVSADIIKRSKWVLVEGYLFSAPNSVDTINAVIREAKAHNTKIAFTMSATFVAEQFRPHVDQVIPHADLVIANSDEAKAYAQTPSDEAAFAYLSERSQHLVVTHGAAGARVRLDGEEAQVAAFETEVIDSTGAGDAFAAGFLFGVCRGANAAGAGRLGCLLGSAAIAQLGARVDSSVRDRAVEAGLLP